MEKLLSRKEAAEILGIKSSTLAVWKSTNRQNLPIVMIGRLPKYRLTDIEAYIQKRTVGIA